MNKKLLLTILFFGFIGCGILACNPILAVSTNFPNTYQISFTGTNTNPDADADASGNVYVVYERSGSIYYKMNRSVEQLVATGTNPDIAVDSATGTVHVVYLDNSGNVIYSKLTGGSWITAPIPGANNATYATIDTDSSNNAYIAYSAKDADGYSDIYYSLNGAAGTILPDLDGQKDGIIDKNYTNPIIKIDANNNYHIACLYSKYVGDPLTDGQFIKVITNAADGNSLSEDLGYDTTGILSQNSLAINSSNNAYVVYTANGNKVYRAIITTTDSWDEASDANPNNYDINGTNASVAANSSTIGVASISSGNIEYREETGSGLGSPDTIDNSGLNSNPVLVLGSNKYVYYENSGNIYLATDQTIPDINAPVVTGVSDKGLYNTDKTITFADIETIPTATLDGNNFNSGDTVSAEGAHTLIVTDGTNTVTIHFTIDKTPPIVTGVADATTYTNAVTITFSDNSGSATATLNGSAFTSGTMVDTNGTYTLIATDPAANSTTVHFTIAVPPTPPSGGGGGGGVIYYTVSATAGANGSITPSGSVSLAYGNSQTFTITPAAGYHVADVKVDGVSKGPITTYAFGSINTNHTISATFAKGALVGAGDINGDGAINEYDFALIMSQWGQTGSNLSADLNKDGVVNEYDFALLMSNWSL